MVATRVYWTNENRGSPRDPCYTVGIGEREARNARGGSEVANVAGRKARLLVVEDSAEICETLEQVLTDEGYEVTIAPDLSHAFATLETQTFDLVLTDLFTVSQIDPLQSVSELRARVAPTAIGVVSGWQVDPEYAKRQGFSFLLTKPFDLDELLACVDSSLNA